MHKFFNMHENLYTYFVYKRDMYDDNNKKLKKNRNNARAFNLTSST
jgi:hypothetical protein